MQHKNKSQIDVQEFGASRGVDSLIAQIGSRTGYLAQESGESGRRWAKALRVVGRRKGDAASSGKAPWPATAATTTEMTFSDKVLLSLISPFLSLISCG